MPERYPFSALKMKFITKVSLARRKGGEHQELTPTPLLPEALPPEREQPDRVHLPRYARSWVRRPSLIRQSTKGEELNDPFSPRSWSPVLTIRTALVSLQSLLSSPEPSDPQDAEVAKHFLSDRASFESTARYWTEVRRKEGTEVLRGGADDFGAGLCQGGSQGGGG